MNKHLHHDIAKITYIFIVYIVNKYTQELAKQLSFLDSLNNLVSTPN